MLNITCKGTLKYGIIGVFTPARYMVIKIAHSNFEVVL
jgi:hypothetical protein